MKGEILEIFNKKRPASVSTNTELNCKVLKMKGEILEIFNKKRPALSRQPTTLKPKQYTQFLTLAGSLKPLPNTRGVFRNTRAAF